MVLDLDIGNTRIKWRLTDEVSTRASYGYATIDDWRDSIDLGVVNRVRVSNVAGEAVRQQIAEVVREVSVVEVEFAQSQSGLAGVTSGYRQPEQLGVDRWLAVVAAYQIIGGNCCVVDCGSAITIDYLDAQGQHLGGLIAPGLRLMQKVLLEGTSQIRIENDVVEEVQLLPRGSSTEQGVARGVRYMEVGLIELANRRFKHQMESQTTLILTGGDAVLISGILESEHCVLPHLVLDGLAIALP